MSRWPRWPRLRLWTQLAAFAALGVVLTHAAHLVFANRIASRALAREQDALGRIIARQIALQATEPLLVEDLVSLNELVAGATAGEGVAYCFVLREGRVVATSFADGTPPALAALSRPDDGPVVVVDGAARYLDLRVPILGGAAGEVRLGMDMAILAATRRNLATLLGLLAVVVILGGLVAALVVGRGIASPLGELLRAADRFDPAAAPAPVRPRGSLEIAGLAERFNQMMLRLRTAHEEQERARQKAVATERMAALGSLVAGVAHEVNNPLAGVKSCLRRLRHERLPPETADEYLELMEEGVERVEHVMARLLDFARPMPARLEAVRLAELAREGMSFVEPILRKRRIAVQLVSQGIGDARALADRKQVGQALLNLLLNAGYVTHDGGEIRLRLRLRPGRCGVSVEDDGPGIPPEIRERVTDPFFSTKPEGEGTGLGLSVTRTIAEANGGELSFEFPGRGTVATLWLPEAPPGLAAPPAETPPPR
ncbi:MAG: HAMP domain-containing protein [Deltaproteobacteria bacterium]|nr:HAMP domain-containing protein [Deltaproteobacteria bacterium]